MNDCTHVPPGGRPANLKMLAVSLWFQKAPELLRTHKINYNNVPVTSKVACNIKPEYIRSRTGECW